MMTTMAALIGTLPIAMGLGAGAESRRPLGLAVVGGLLFSQLVTLYATPVFYLYMETWRTMLRRKPKALEETSIEDEENFSDGRDHPHKPKRYQGIPALRAGSQRK